MCSTRKWNKPGALVQPGINRIKLNQWINNILPLTLLSKKITIISRLRACEDILGIPIYPIKISVFLRGQIYGKGNFSDFSYIFGNFIILWKSGLFLA